MAARSYENGRIARASSFSPGNPVLYSRGLRDADPWTDLGQDALAALRFTSVADAPAMENHVMTEHGPILFGNQVHQITFHFFGRRFFCKTKPPTEPAHVRVHGDAGHSKCVSQNDVGG